MSAYVYNLDNGRYLATNTIPALTPLDSQSIVWFYYPFATFKLNIYTKFRKVRQGSPWKPITLMKRTTF